VDCPKTTAGNIRTQEKTGILETPRFMHVLQSNELNA
jgi:hypothetical protein